jgi:hypothetical protein
MSSIGEPDSEARRISDEKYNLVYNPVLTDLKYDVIRADKEITPYSISRDIISRVIKSEMAIADISDLNANVFYELAVRNAVKMPVIIVKDVDQKLPFDVYDKRAISINMNDNYRWTSAKEELKSHILAAEKSPQDASESIISYFDFKIDAASTQNTNVDINNAILDLRHDLKSLTEYIRSDTFRFWISGRTQVESPHPLLTTLYSGNSPYTAQKPDLLQSYRLLSGIDPQNPLNLNTADIILIKMCQKCGNQFTTTTLKNSNLCDKCSKNNLTQ